MTFIDRMNDIASVIGYLTVLAALGFASVLVYTGIKQDRAERRSAAEFVAGEERQSDQWRETLKHEIEPPDWIKESTYRSRTTQQFRPADYPTDSFAAGAEMLANRGQR